MKILLKSFGIMLLGGGSKPKQEPPELHSIKYWPLCINNDDGADDDDDDLRYEWAKNGNNKSK